MASLVVLGSTGAIGRRVVREALRRPEIGKVVALTRTLVQPSITTGQNPSELYSKLFDINVQELQPNELSKLHPVTFDWEAFMQAWATARTMALAQSTPAQRDSEDEVMRALAPYKEALWGHTYAAVCLGTTRHDAGSAPQFIRCDFDYVVAFTEALLCLSAPHGFVVPQSTARANATDGFCYHVNDGMRQANNTGALKRASQSNNEQDDASRFGEAARNHSSRTLRKIFYVSSYNASANSMLLYVKTKGRVEAALQERIVAHNAVVKPINPSDKSADTLQLGILRPGLLDRGAKARTVEKVARFVMSAMPVETCARCIVNECVHDTNKQGQVTFYKNDDITRCGKE